MQQKLFALFTALRSYPRVAVAFSGGVDSAVLLRAAMEILAVSDVLAVTAVSSLLPEAEKEEIARVAAELGANHRFVAAEALLDADFQRNDTQRCYFCKRLLFRRMQEVSRESGFGTLLEGSNADDSAVWRPGRKALAECGIPSPLAEAGLRKDEIREFARMWGISVAEKPAASCLATRFAYGIPLSEENFRHVDAAERFLKTLLAELTAGTEATRSGAERPDRSGERLSGSDPVVPLTTFAPVPAAISGIPIRVRVHADRLARIELPPEYFPLIVREDIHPQITAEFRRLGFRFISLDLEGFRSGSFDS